VVNFSSTASFIWSVADLLRGDFKQSQYGRIILPFTVLRRLECVLVPTKVKVLEATEKHKDMGPASDALLRRAARQAFYNTSPMNLSRLGETQIRDNLDAYVQGFSPEAREIFEHFHFTDFLDQLQQADLLFKVVQKFASMDLSPEALNNHAMGFVFEELIRRFAESSNETAGEHFTPRDIVTLATSLVFIDDDDTLSASGVVRSLYDPTAGTGGFLSSGSELVYQFNPDAQIAVFGQELNPESYAICKADMLIKGQDIANIKLGNTLSGDQLTNHKFDYMLSNPPFGVDWKKVQKEVTDEHKQRGYGGRFGPGLPRVSDGSLLFLLHLVSKMRAPDDGGSRIGIILNGSPLFTGGAGSGESEIRRYLLENDYVEGIVALPTDMFYNTGIATYVWVLSNRKTQHRKGKVLLVNATQLFGKMRKSLGSKRNMLTEKDVDTIVELYGAFEEGELCRIFDTTDFGYRRITVERPLQLAFHPGDRDRVATLENDNTFIKWPDDLRQAVLSALPKLQAKYSSREAFKKALKRAGTSVSSLQFKLLQKHLSAHDPEAEVCMVKGVPEPDADLRDNENVPLGEDIDAYFAREVLPHVPDAWIDREKRDDNDGKVGIVGYEIPFNRHFYKYTPPRPLEEIDRDLRQLSQEITALLGELAQ